MFFRRNSFLFSLITLLSAPLIAMPLIAMPLIATPLIAMPWPARADFQAGLAAYQKGAFDDAYRELLPAAETGDPRAMHLLGFLYAKGRGVERDMKKAVALWQGAAEKSHPPAQFTIGNLYLKGVGVSKDPKAAAGWIQKSADAGYADAQFLLGVLYAKGEGIPRDLVQAYMWLDIAAEQKGLEPGAFWDAVTPYLTPKEVREGNNQINDWNLPPGAGKPPEPPKSPKPSP